MTSVLIAEDDALLRSLLIQILAGHDDLHVAAEVADGREAVAAVDAHRPQVLLLDLTLPGLSGMEVLALLADRPERPRVLVLSGTEDPDTQLAAVRSGAAGFLGKSRAAGVLVEAVRSVASGGVWLAPDVVSRVVQDYPTLSRQATVDRSPLARLTERERDVLARVARGMTNQQIASDLIMSLSTVKTHLQSIFRKLELPSRTEAAVLAVREGLLERESRNGFAGRVV
jgi:DNA-binding NarL/FixJ family response regulator